MVTIRRQNIGIVESFFVFTSKLFKKLREMEIQYKYWVQLKWVCHSPPPKNNETIYDDGDPMLFVVAINVFLLYWPVNNFYIGEGFRKRED